jgi:hypothetical protein
MAKSNVLPGISCEFVVGTGQNSVPRYEADATVTSTEHDDCLPMLSVAVNRTVYTPALLAVNIVGFDVVDENVYVAPDGAEITDHMYETIVAGGMAEAMPMRFTVNPTCVETGAGHVTVGLQLGSVPVQAWSRPSHCGGPGSISPEQPPHCVPPPVRAMQL